MKLDENDYPMTYKEYEKKVIDLFFQDYDGKALEEMIKRADELLDEEPNFIQTLYGQSCFIFESPHIYGEDCKKCFEDNFLMQTPVSQLRMLIG